MSIPETESVWHLQHLKSDPFLYFILCFWKQIVICHLWRTKIKSITKLFFFVSFQNWKRLTSIAFKIRSFFILHPLFLKADRDLSHVANKDNVNNWTIFCLFLKLKRLTSPAFKTWSFLYFILCFWKQIVICHLWRRKIKSIIKFSFVYS